MSKPEALAGPLGDGQPSLQAPTRLGCFPDVRPRGSVLHGPFSLCVCTQIPLFRKVTGHTGLRSRLRHDVLVLSSRTCNDLVSR